MELVHRFTNGPSTAADGTLRWPLDAILAGVERGMRLCADRAPEGIQSVGVDGWAVDYVRLDAKGEPLELPFCYRDERTETAQLELHALISPDRLREITGLQLQKLNTLYQLFADKIAGKSAGTGWLNLPEYLLSYWGGERVAEFTNATHTQMMDVQSHGWSDEVLAAANIDPKTMPRIVPPGTILGSMSGHLTGLPAFRDTLLIAPACHDTASAVAGIPASGDDWGYISCGTWSLVGTPVPTAKNGFRAREQQFTNLGLDGDRFLFQKNMNGMWLMKQCLDAWSTQGKQWEVGKLCKEARTAPTPRKLLNVDDPELHRMGNMPARINAQLIAHGAKAMDETPSGAPQMASLIFHSLAARYAELFVQIEAITGKAIRRIYIVGGGSQNAFLRELITEVTGKEVYAGSAESSTVGNFALQLAALTTVGGSNRKRELATMYAAKLCGEPFKETEGGMSIAGISESLPSRLDLGL